MGEQELLKIQQRKNFVIKFCYWAVIAVCIYTGLKYLLSAVFFMIAGGLTVWLGGGMAFFGDKENHCISPNGLSRFCLSVFGGRFCMDRGAVCVG